jgi:hypothetical protein
MRINQLTESNKVLYHGDDFGTTKLLPEWMMHSGSNNQEGVGIYFTPDIEVAKTYGNKISSISTENLRIVDSRASLGKAIRKPNAINLMKYLNEVNEDFWYKISDYIEVTGPEDVEDYHFNILYDMMKTQEIRNWQLEMSQASSTIDLVTGWNKYIPIDGLYERVSKFYSIINTNVDVKPVNF